MAISAAYSWVELYKLAMQEDDDGKILEAIREASRTMARRLTRLGLTEQRERKNIYIALSDLRVLGISFRNRRQER